MKPATPAEALAEVRRCATAGRVRMDAPHVRLRMAQRNVRERDVFCALRNARHCAAGGEAERWKVTGPDLDDDDLTVVVVFEAGVIVVTVF
jgi:Domain of unknown function (DUF4258)